ncbi:MAG: hypothetical protein R2730_06290 [Chitinophagales bacterium]
MKINLRAAFLGLKFLPHPLGIGGNNLNPKLLLHDNEIEYRNVFTTRKLHYNAIEKVNTFTTFKTNNIIIKPFNSIFTHSFNVKDKEQFKMALKFLSEKNCPLTDKAIKMMEN